MDEKELELISRYFDADSFVPLTEKKDYRVYRAFIRKTSDLHVPVPCEAVFKFLSETQAGIYSRLIDIHSPYIENILGVYGDNGSFFSLSENISRPSRLEYGMADQFPGLDTSSLTLSQFVSHYRIFEPQMPKRFKDDSFLSEDLALKIAYLLCEGLTELNKKKLIHGDLSPQNILLADPPETNDGKKLPFKYAYPFIPRIIDFGATKPKKPDDHPMTSIIGTHNFVAPEILAYNKPNDRMDIYSVGCLIHFMLTGSAPGEHGLKSSRKILSKGVYKIVAKCNADYDTRYKSLELLKRDILKELRIATSSSERFLYKVPGFRSHKAWKMAIGGYMYLAIAIGMINSIIYWENGGKKLLASGIFCILEIILIFDVFHLGSLSKAYTETGRRHPALRILTKTLIAILLCVFYSWVYSLI